MKYAFLLASTLLFSLLLQASERAVTEEGEIVVLHPDGTWVYEKNQGALEQTNEIPTNSDVFTKSQKSNFKLKSKKTNAVVWLKASDWNFGKAVNNEEAEYQFQLKGEDLYAMMITERVPIPIETLANIALENARVAGGNMSLVKKEYRVVNDEKVIYMEMAGTIQGIEFTYLGHFFSNSSGSTQLITFTSTGLVDRYQEDIAEFLNGLSVEG